MQQHNSIDASSYIEVEAFPETSQFFQWNLPQVHTFNSVHLEHDPFLIPPAPAPVNVPPSFGGSFNLRQMGFQIGAAAPFGLHAELQKMSAQEIIDAKALAASKSHSEAERRRRERINNHLAKLRSLLPSTTKTDKASLLAEVIQHVKELKRQTSQIAETSPIPTECDDLCVENATNEFERGKSVIKASICCEDRHDLLPDLINTMKALKLKTLKAEITTLGGRVKNVLFITGDEDSNEEYSIASIQEALRGVMEKCSVDESGSGNVKRQRTNNISILEHRTI